MEPIVTQTTNPDINELVRLYAKDKGLSDTAAWAAIRTTVVPRSEVLNILSDHNQSKSQGGGQSKLAEIIAEKQNTSLEMKRLEMQERTEAREQRRLEIEESRLALEKEIQMRKLEIEERRQQSKEDFDRTLLLLQTGKKPDEVEMVKNQERFYERLLEAKTDHMTELMKLRAEIEDRANKGDTSAQDFIKRMNEYNEMQDTVIRSSLGFLRSRGVSEDQLEAMSKSVNKQDDGSIGKIWDVAKTVWKQIEPKINVPQQTPEQQLALQRQAFEQQRLQKEREDALRKQVEEEARKLEEHNTLLEQEKIKLKQIEETNRQFEAQYIEQRNDLVKKAMDRGVLVDGSMTNEQIFVLLEQADARAERNRKTIQKEIQTEDDAFYQPQPQENKIVTQNPEPEVVHKEQKSEPVLEDPETRPLWADDIIAKDPENIDPEPDPEIVSEDEPANELESEITGNEPPIVQEAIIRAPRIRKSKKNDKIFRITRVDDGTLVAEIPGTKANGVAMRVVRELGGTRENKIRIRVTDMSNNEERLFDTYLQGNKPIANRLSAKEEEEEKEKERVEAVS